MLNFKTIWLNTIIDTKLFLNKIIYFQMYAIFQYLNKCWWKKIVTLDNQAFLTTNEVICCWTVLNVWEHIIILWNNDGNKLQICKKFSFSSPCPKLVKTVWNWYQSCMIYLNIASNIASILIYWKVKSIFCSFGI